MNLKITFDIETFEIVDIKQTNEKVREMTIKDFKVYKERKDICN